MKRLVILFAVMLCVATAFAQKFSYSFNHAPLADALVQIAGQHPDIHINFIYNELDKYPVTATIYTNDAYDMLRQLIGLNPVSVISSGGRYYVEALQHGKYCYTGKAVGSDSKPVVAATVMLLAPKDSTVITYGITDETGRFSLPCDKRGVIAKLTCLGYKPTYKMCESCSVGTIYMSELPIHLQTVKVEADNAYLFSDRSVYRPTQRQKNASQTANDLLVMMAIPQLNARLGSSSVTTASGQPVSVYIDYVPASENDLKMMRISDVKSVEYLEYPSDARFQGNRFVINFRMTQYEYGGYVKALGTENFIANSGFFQANARFVKNKMTYDVMGYGYYISNNHLGVDQIEAFRLSQENGEIKSFQRESETESSKYRRNNYQTSFRALYSGDNITANSQIAVGLDNTPCNNNTGVVKYTDNLLEPSKYSSKADSKAKNLSYNGFYYLGLANDNSLSASLSYSYSHTNQNSLYSETDMDMIYNGAKDNTHKGNIVLNYSQSFCKKHSFTVLIRGLYEHNRTNYSGSVTALDNSSTKFGQVGASYRFSDKKISASLGFGWNWLATRLDDNKAISNYPYIDASFSLTPNKKNSFGTGFHYSVWPPSSNYKSENIIQVSPFLWHTGNPLLKSHRSYDVGINYTFIPSDKFSMTVFANSWFVGNRAAFVYEATSQGIIRTIQQPIGTFSHYNYGINASSIFFDGKLHLSGQLSQLYVHNGLPYNINHSCINYYVQVLYYRGNFNFAISYNSENATDNYNSMSGIWTKNKDVFILQAGWSNSTWNIRLRAQNLQRWNWRSSYDTMQSNHYSVNKCVSNASAHAFVQLSIAYTFGFGKKVKQGNDISRQSGASSGILK